MALLAILMMYSAVTNRIAISFFLFFFLVKNLNSVLEISVVKPGSVL